MQPPKDDPRSDRVPTVVAVGEMQHGRQQWNGSTSWEMKSERAIQELELFDMRETEMARTYGGRFWCPGSLETVVYTPIMRVLYYSALDCLPCIARVILILACVRRAQTERQGHHGMLLEGAVQDVRGLGWRDEHIWRGRCGHRDGGEVTQTSSSKRLSFHQVRPRDSKP